MDYILTTLVALWTVFIVSVSVGLMMAVLMHVFVRAIAEPENLLFLVSISWGGTCPAVS